MFLTAILMELTANRKPALRKKAQDRKKLEVLVFVYYASYGVRRKKSLSLSNFMKFVDDVKYI